jgi:hypothetical protein
MALYCHIISVNDIFLSFSVYSSVNRYLINSFSWIILVIYILVNTGTCVFSCCLILFLSDVFLHHSSFYNILYLMLSAIFTCPIIPFHLLQWSVPFIQTPCTHSTCITLHFQPFLWIFRFKPRHSTSCPLQNLVSIVHAYPKFYFLMKFIIIFYPSAGDIMTLCMSLLNCVNACAFWNSLYLFKFLQWCGFWIFVHFVISILVQFTV